MTHDAQRQRRHKGGKPRSASATKAAPFASDSPSGTGRAGGRHYAEEIKQAARGLYLKRHTVTEIAAALSVPKRTVYYWAEQGQWDDLLCHEGAEEAAHGLFHALGADPRGLRILERRGLSAAFCEAQALAHG